MSQTLQYVISHVLWLVSSGLAIFTMILTHRALSKVYALLSGGGWQFRWIHSALDRFGILILGVVALAFVFVCEHYYREGVEKGEFWKRFLIVTGGELILLILVTGVSLL